MSRPRAAAVWAALAVAGGAGALVVETTWLRWLRLLLGATAPAASAALVAFLLGQALGAALAARRLPRADRPLRGFGAIELGAAASAAAVPLLLAGGEALLGVVYDGVRDDPAALVALRFGVALAATLPTALLWGASLPFLTAAALPAARALGATGAALYGANTLGAALGTALAAFWLPEALGVRGSYAVGLALSALAGATALAWARRTSRATPAATRRERRSSRRRRDGERSAAAEPGGGGRLPALAALSGFGVFAAEVLMVQAFAQVLNQSVYAFGAVLVVVLAALALGAALVSLAAGRGRVPARSFLGLALAASALALLAFPAVLYGATDGLRFVGSERPWPGYLLAALGVAAAAAGPALLAAGLVFPLVLALAGERAGEASGAEGGARLGRLVAANTLGAVAGALAAPYLLLPLLGPWTSFLALSGLYALAAVFLRDVAPAHRLLRDLGLAAGWVAILALASPLDLPLVRLADGQRALSTRATPAGIVAVVEDAAGERLIRTDNHYNLGGTAEIVHEERQGHLPLLLHPAPRRVAFVGSATGISAGAALAHPVERIVLVELVPGVARAARRFFASANRGVYDAPRSRIVPDDARNFLRLTHERFDVVVADLFVPWREGVSSLYAREHLQSVRARLTADGVFCQWLPLYQLGREEMDTLAVTFADVFPEAALFRGDFYGRYPIVALCGFAGRPPSAADVSAAARRLAARGERDRWMTDPLGPWALYVGPLAPLARRDPDWAATPRNTDDRPRIQYLAARRHAGGDRGPREPLVGLAWARFDERVRAAAAAAGDPLFPDLPLDARRAAQGGAALQGAGALWVADRRDDAAAALASAADLLPARLLASAPPDPSAAEVWRDTLQREPVRR